MDRSLTHWLMTFCSNSVDSQSTATIIRPADSVPSIRLSRLTGVLPMLNCRASSSSMTCGSRPMLCSTAAPQASQEKMRSIRRTTVEWGRSG